MSYVRDWEEYGKGPVFETYEEARDDFLENYYLYCDEIFDNFIEKVGLYKLMQWAIAQESFIEKFGNEYEIAEENAFAENYPEHEEE